MGVQDGEQYLKCREYLDKRRDKNLMLRLSVVFNLSFMMPAFVIDTQGRINTHCVHIFNILLSLFL